MRKRFNYGEKKLTIGDYPRPNIVPNGTHAGTPCLELLTGKDIELTNTSLRDYIEKEYPLTKRVFIQGDEDPTLFSEELWSYIKYHNDTSERQRIFHILTSGRKYIPKFLYQLDHITIEVKVPSTGEETPPEFICWCAEDKDLIHKIEFQFTVPFNITDINYVIGEIPKLGTFKRPITIIPGYWSKSETKRQFEICDKNDTLQAFEEQQAQPEGWRSYLHFAESFMDTLRYPKVRLQADLQRVFGLKRFDRIL